MPIRALLCFCSLCLLTAYSAAQNTETDFSAGPQYLLNGSPLLARSLATKSVSLDAPLPPIQPSSIPIPRADAGVSYVTNPELAHQADLIPIYYGEPNVYGVPELSAVEISFPAAALESVAPLPPSIAETGVTQFVDAQALRVRGYDVPLGDVAAYWKTHEPQARHDYTNKDVKRLHSSG